MTYSSAPFHSAPLEPLAPSDSSSPDPFSGYDNSVSGVVFFSSLQFLLLSFLPPPPRFRSSPGPASSLFRSSPTIFGVPLSPPLFRPLTESQNWPRCNKLRDRILSPEDRCTHPHNPCVLYCSRQGEVLPLPVPPSAWQSPRQPPRNPALEGVQVRLHLHCQYPGLRPEEEDLLCHGNIEIA